MPNNALCGAHEARVLSTGCTQHQAIGSGLLLRHQNGPIHSFIHSFMAHLKYNKKRPSTMCFSWSLILIPFKFKTPPEPSYSHVLHFFNLHHFHMPPKQTLLRYYLGRVFGQLSEFLSLNGSTAFDTADLSLLKTLQLSNTAYKHWHFTHLYLQLSLLFWVPEESTKVSPDFFTWRFTKNF